MSEKRAKRKLVMATPKRAPLRWKYNLVLLIFAVRVVSHRTC